MRYLLLIAVLFSLASAASAQSALSSLAAGTRVRISAPGMSEGKIVGSLAALSSDSVTIIRAKEHRQLSLSLDDVASIDRSRGRSRGISALVGAVGGAIAGAGLGLVCVSVCTETNNSGANLAPIGGFVIGLPAGAIIGALVGMERWQRVRFR